MTLALIALFGAFTAYMLYFMVKPLIGKDDSARADLLSEDLRQSEELSSLKALNTSALRDLKVDRELKKITQEDYLQLKREHESRAVKAMRELDQLHGGRDWRERVEAALAARRGPLQLEVSRDQTPAEHPTAEEHDAPSKKRTKKKPKATEASPPVDRETLGACPSFSFSNNDPKARFCSRCGAPMPALEVSHSTSEPSRSEVN